MVAPATAFKVVSEFQFEIGSAVLSTQTLQNEVGKLSSLADEALFSFKSLGLGLAANLGLGGGGALGLFSNAIQSSEKFRDVQLSLSTIISANRDVLTGTIDTFNDRLSSSSKIIKDIVADARKFGINEAALLETTKLLSAQLVPKGFAGTDFEVPREISRDLLKAAPVLGVDPGLVQGQLLRIIEGSASIGDTLFRRLKSETQAFSDIKTSKQFNILQAAERLDRLRRGLGQFTNDSEVLEDRLFSLSGQMAKLKSLTLGVDAILRPLGDVLKRPIIKVLSELNKILEQKGSAIVQSFANVLAPLVESPRSLIINLMQMKEAMNDVSRTGKALATGGIFGLIGFALSKLTGIARLASPVISIVGIVFSGLLDTLDRVSNPLIAIITDMIKLAGVLTIIAGVLFKFGLLNKTLLVIGFAIKTVIPPMLALLGFFQLISRAVAIARVNDAQNLVDVSAKFAQVSEKIFSALNMIITPFAMLFNAVAELISPLFSVTLTINPLIDILNLTAKVLDKLGNGFITLAALMDGSLAAMAFFVENFNIMDIFSVDALADNAGKAGAAFDDAFNAFVENAVSRQGQGGNTIVQQNIQVDKIDIKNEFKEQQEPDRVAFTIKDQIMKAATNPVQSLNKGLSTGLQGSLTASGI